MCARRQSGRGASTPPPAPSAAPAQRHSLPTVPGRRRDNVSKREPRQLRPGAGTLRINSAPKQRFPSNAEGSSACASYVQPIPRIHLNYIFAGRKKLDQEFASAALSSKRGFSGYFVLVWLFLPPCRAPHQELFAHLIPEIKLLTNRPVIWAAPCLYQTPTTPEAEKGFLFAIKDDRPFYSTCVSRRREFGSIFDLQNDFVGS